MTAPVGISAEAVELDRRLGHALGTHDVHPEVRGRIQDAWFPGATWADLPADIQQLVQQCEALPAQSWDDPMDVPDNLDED